MKSFEEMKVGRGADGCKPWCSGKQAEALLVFAAEKTQVSELKPHTDESTDRDALSAAVHTAQHQPDTTLQCTFYFPFLLFFFMAERTLRGS